MSDWKERESRIMRKIILDLCGGTGSWSKPYKDAGYEVYVLTLPKNDIRTLEPIPNKVHGILAAPPCTMFSLARTNAKKPRDLDEGLEIVKHCMRLIWAHKPDFWAMENPKGLLRKFMGKPAFAFDASEFGCDYNKHTDLWGYFKEPKKTHAYHRYESTTKNVRKLPPIPADYERDWNMKSVQVRRSITPQEFAQAFYKANS